MSVKNTTTSRKQQILECLASMLENGLGERITTARLAAEVGVSEAALYRHFPSKARMFEALIEFIEESLFSRINKIMNEEQSSLARCSQVVLLVLTFSTKNPGISRILTGDALAGEQGRLRERVAQLFVRIETQLKQVIREAELRENLQPAAPPAVLANLMLAFIDGRIQQFVRSGFALAPTDNWEQQWSVIEPSFFKPQPTSPL
ncbi:MAG: nucleoid occlusion factor SlmA [Pseudomonadota bacterium]